MLDLLEQYAVRKNLVAEPGFKAKTARRIIELNAEGEFIGINSPKDKAADFEFDRCPDLTQSEMVTLGGIATHPLLSECSSIALLTEKEGVEADAKQLAKHIFFVERIKEVAELVPAFRSVAIALTNPDTVAAIRDELRKAKAKNTDKATFFVGEDFPIKSEEWWDWWRTRRAELVSTGVSKGSKKTPSEVEGEADQMVCFVTGTPTAPLRVHPKITGLGDVGGQAQVPFLGFDKEAFRSYGLEQSANAAVSEDAAYAYRAALDDLLKKGERITGMKVAHWFDKEVLPGNDVFHFLFKDDAPDVATEGDALAQARRLLRLLKDGGEKAHLASYRYYALSLSGAGGRVMVRDWMTGSFEALTESIVRWFNDFAIAPLGDGYLPSPLLWRVILSALSPNETGDKGVGSIKIPLWKAALDSNRPIPDAAVIRVLHLHRAFIVTGELDNAKRKTPLSTLYIRMGLLKASLIRKGKSMTANVNPAYESSAYHCGRLIAMLAALQRAALPDVDAGVAQRYYGAASVTPRLVVGRLTRLAQHHVAKVASNSKGLAYWYESRIGEIVTAINGSNKPLPATFSTQEQTEFALGYYQQIAENRTKKSDKSGNTPDVDPEPGTDTLSADDNIKDA